MKTSRKRVRIVFAVLLAVTLWMAYLEFGILPGTLKRALIGHLETRVGGTVDFRRVLLLPLRGIVVDDLTVTPKDGRYALFVDRLSLRVAPIAFLRDNKIVLKSVRMHKPRIDYRAAIGRAAGDSTVPGFPSDGIAPLVTFLRHGVDVYIPENVYLGKFSVKKGTLRLSGLAGSDEATEWLRDIRLRIDFNKRPQVPYRGSYSVGDREYSRIEVEGFWEYATDTHKFRARGHAKRMPEWLAEIEAFRHVRFGDLKTDFDIRFTYADGVIRFALMTDHSQGSFTWNDFRFDGAYRARIEGVHEPRRETTSLSEAKIFLADTSIEGLPSPYDAMHVKEGSISLKEGSVTFSNLKADWKDHPVTLSGVFNTEAPRPYSLEMIEEGWNLSILKDLSSPGAERLLNIVDFQGPVHIEIGLTSALDDPASKEKSLRITPRNASLEFRPIGRKYTHATGDIIWKRGTLRIKDLRFDADGKPIRLGGTLSQAPAETSRIRLEHPKFTADAELLYDRDYWNINSLDIRTGESSFDLKGRVTKSGPGHFEIEGNAYLNAEDVASLLEERWPWIGKLKPSGKILADVRFEGSPLESRTLQLSLRSSPAEISLGEKNTIRNMEFDLLIDGGVLKLTYARGVLYGGDLRLTGSLAADPDLEPRMDLNFRVLDADLSLMANQFDFFSEDISGKLNLDFGLNGLWSDRKSLTGEGYFEIKEGHLWSTPLFRKLGDLTFVRIKGMEHVNFNHAEGSFFFDEGAVHTQDAVLKSPAINIWIAGKASFDRLLDLRLRSRFTPAVIRQSYEIGGIAPFAVGLAEDKITEYHVTGSLTDPQYVEL